MDAQLSSSVFLSLLLLLLGALLATHAHALTFMVRNEAQNSPGGIRFTKEIGVAYTIATLENATDFTWWIFNQSSKPAERRSYEQVTWLLSDAMEGVASTIANETRVSARYVENYAGDIKAEITGIIFDENAHVWQWDGTGKANRGLVEGIAAYVRLKASLTPIDWVKPGEGDRWKEGSDITGMFLDYCMQ